jgi:trehalose 6-phosphate phosphatase
MIDTTMPLREASGLPSALQKAGELKNRLSGKTMVVFLDYDGCLAPIVKDPDQALLSDEMRQVLQQLAEKSVVAVVSGRDRQNVERLVQLETVYYAGSHGFDISGPGGMRAEPGEAKETLPALDQAEQELQELLQGIAGARVERKRYAIAVHYRNVAKEEVKTVKHLVQEISGKYDNLKEGRGKKIRELRPNLDWHKGHAVQWLLRELGLDRPDVVPVFVGDDITDEDAFAVLQERGITVLVGEHSELTAAVYHLEGVPEVQEFLNKLAHLVP